MNLVKRLGERYGGLWRKSKLQFGLVTLVLFCLLCACVATLASLTPGAQQSARATAEARSAHATAQFVETDSARAAEGMTATFVAGLPSATPRPTDTPIPTNTPGPTSTPAPPTSTSLPTNTPDPANVLTSLAREQFRDALKAAKLTDVSGLRVANVDYDLGLQWDENSAVFDAQGSFIEFAPKVFAGTDAALLELRSFTSFKDALGNEKDEVAFKFTLTRGLASKVNWKGIDRRRLELALSTEQGNGVYVHPALRKAWADSQR